MDDLRCNSLKCRKSLSLEGSAVVTTCSHIFCIECANNLFSQPQICPACETSLPEPDDAVQTNLSPPDAYKTSVLAGLSPILVLDIASRALNFYTYQVQQESAFQSLVTKNAQERIAVLESQCQNIIREATSEITLLKDRVNVSERDLELERRKVRDLQETHKGNAKAYNKLKAQLDKAQQRALLVPNANNNLANNFVSAAANQSIPPVHPPQFNSHPQHQSSTPRPSSALNNANDILHNRALQGWANTFAAGNVPSSQPISNQPGHSVQRPRRSLQDPNNSLNVPNSNIQNIRQQSTTPLDQHRHSRSSSTLDLNHHNQNNSFVSGGQGYFGSSGLAGVSTNRRGNPGGNTSDSSGGSGGKNNGNTNNNNNLNTNTTGGNGVLKYLGQQNRVGKTNGGFRPAAGAFQ